MAPKPPTPFEDPPPVSSDEGEEEEGSSSEEEGLSSGEEDEEEESSSEEEQEEEPPKKPSPPQTPTRALKPASQKLDSTKKPPKPEPRLGKESESDSESESEPEGKKSVSSVKPIASKPMPRSKQTPPATASPPAKSVKRVSTTDEGAKDSKRAKTDVVGAKESTRAKVDGSGVVVAVEKSEDTKKQLFQRLWSDDDEIALLKGIIKFKAKRGMDPGKDMNGFFEYIKKSLHLDVALSQLKDKVWRLKKKFENHIKKEQQGVAKAFSSPHEQMRFDLSKKIWSDGISDGGGRVAESRAVKSNGKAEKKSSGSGGGDKKKLGALNLEVGMGVTTGGEGQNIEVAGERGLGVLEDKKKADMEEKQRKLRVAELKLFLKRQELLKEQAELLLAAYKAEEEED